MINSLIYNWYTFWWTGATITESNDDNSWIVDIQSFSNPNRIWETFINAFPKKKVIEISWRLKSSTKYWLNNLIDKVFWMLLNTH